jgi:hypothetical protein
MLKLSKKILVKIVEPLQSIKQLVPIIQNLLETSSEQIIFLDRIEYELDNYLQRGFKYLKF